MADPSSSERNAERSKEMQCFATRLHTFQTVHQLSKRRTSQQSKKKGEANVVEWPHDVPSGEDLARAGFFYRPALDSLDNVQCFHCAVKLDGWEASDDPLKEHLNHSASCDWALAITAAHAAQQAQRQGGEASLLQQQDPMSAELLKARRGTFEANGGSWPHESKKGWKCKVSKMVEAGWCYDPAPPSSADEDEEQDSVTCFYCNLSLDGWEPKDDPFQEHTRRMPGCPFFALVQSFGSGAGKKGAKGKKAAARTSTASKTSRLSVQSAVSQFSEPPSLADVGAVPFEEADGDAGADDSIVTTASQATTTKGKKGKGGRAKAPAKGAKGRKRAGTADSQAEAPVYPDLSSQAQSQDEQPSQSQPAGVVEATAPAKKTRKAPVRSSKAPQIDSSVIEISSLDLAPQPQTKAKRGRKAKAKAEPEPEPTQEDDTDVSAQLQDELERSLSIDMDAKFELEDLRSPEPEKPKRGTKRTSDGLKKAQQPQEDSDVSATVMEFPIPPKAAPAAAKGKKGGRKASKQIDAESSSQPLPAAQEDVNMSDVEATKPAKGKKGAAAKGKGKGKKASSARSSRSSKATVTDAEQPTEEAEDLERDEREIEAELERIAAEQAKIASEQDKTAEFEGSPTLSRSADRQPRKASEKIVEAVAGSPPAHSPILHKKPNPTPSPTGSDKENDPSQTKPTLASPTKTTRVPLAPGTPNRLLASPSKRALLSPSKHISHLASAVPWDAIDLDAVLLASPQPTPATLAARLAGAAVGAAGALASPEKGMSVEEWVRFQAAQGEVELRRKCEEMVGVFEREGLRALGCLEGIQVVG